MYLDLADLVFGFSFLEDDSKSSQYYLIPSFYAHPEFFGIPSQTWPQCSFYIQYQTEEITVVFEHTMHLLGKFPEETATKKTRVLQTNIHAELGAIYW